MCIRLCFLLFALPLLAACATQAEPPTDTGLPPPPMSSDVGGENPAGQVDFSCSVDADCAVKNVGNCCGYYPACVNSDSPTFPEQVAERCAQEGMMSVCGFREISSCQCVDNRCSAVHASGQHPGRIEIE